MDSKQMSTDRQIVMYIKKKDSAFWPRLLKTDTKQLWLKTDFDRWVDEDESGDEMGAGGGGGGPGAGGMDFSNMMSQMSGFGGMDDMGTDGDVDSDDEDLPDLDTAPTTNGDDKK